VKVLQTVTLGNCLGWRVIWSL